MSILSPENQFPKLGPTLSQRSIAEMKICFAPCCESSFSCYFRTSELVTISVYRNCGQRIVLLVFPLSHFFSISYFAYLTFFTYHKNFPFVLQVCMVRTKCSGPFLWFVRKYCLFRNSNFHQQNETRNSSCVSNVYLPCKYIAICKNNYEILL